MPSFEALIEQHYAELYRYAKRMLYDHCDAEDAVQDAVMNAWKAWPPAQDTHLRPWLFRIVHNVCVTEYRHRETVIKYLHIPVLYSPTGYDDDPEDIVTRQEAIDAFHAALQYMATLSPAKAAQAAALEAYCLYDGDTRRMRNYLHISPSVLKQRLFHARKSFAALYRHTP